MNGPGKGYCRATEVDLFTLYKNKEANMKIEFPQPLRDRSKLSDGMVYWYVTSSHQICCSRFYSSNHFDENIFEAGGMYLTEGEAVLRLKHDDQRLKSLIIPQWFSNLGDKVETLINGKWVDFTLNDISLIGDWNNAEEINFRKKPEDVLVIVNNKPFRWPANPTEKDPPGERWRFSFGQIKDFYACIDPATETSYGPNVHFTKAGAEMQRKALKESMRVLLGIIL
jgi:hypothetical protein